MRDATAMFEPVVEVRDVLESFLVNGVLVTDWHATLTDASGRFESLGELWSDAEIVQLGRQVRVLAIEGLGRQDALTRFVASEVERLLDEVRVPGQPRPDDQNWGF